MALEIICEHAQRTGRAAHLLQRPVQLLALHGIRLDEVVSVVERRPRTDERSACAHECQVQAA